MKNFLPVFAVMMSLVGCSSLDVNPIPLASDADILSGCEVGESCAVSMGQSLFLRCEGPWRAVYTPNKSLIFERISPVNGSGWVARYSDPGSGKRYLTNLDFYNGAIGVLVDATGAPVRPIKATQITGAKAGRSWELSQQVSDVQFELTGCQSDSALAGLKGWELNYVDHVRGVLRFTVQEFEWNGQKSGDVTYSHDLDAGSEMVFRGVRLRIESIGSDGVLRYSVLGKN